MLCSLLRVASAQAINSLADANGQEGQQQSFWKSMLAADPVTQKQKDMKARLGCGTCRSCTCALLIGTTDMTHSHLCALGSMRSCLVKHLQHEHIQRPTCQSAGSRQEYTLPSAMCCK